MDFQQFGIDERLISGAQALRSRALFHEKMLERAVAADENVCAKIALDEGREAVLLLPALQWLASAPAGEAPRRILCLAPDRATAERLAVAARVLGAGLDLRACVVTPPEEGEGAATGPASAPVLEGDPGAVLVAGLPESLLAAEAAGLLSLRSFGYLLVEGAERVAELAPELLRRLSSAMLPPWERKSILSCSRLTVKAKSLAWDLADNPVEIEIEEQVAKAQSVASETWQVETGAKLRFVLGLLRRERPARLCLFCDLKSSAEEVALRLRENGIEAAFVVGALPEERKFAVLERIKEVPGSVLVLSDEGAAGVTPGEFPLVLNYELPLEPDLYVRRLEMLDRAAPGARVVNLACDRYAVGLPAIERYIDAKLEARQAGPELLEAEDASADLVFEAARPERDSRGGGGSKVGRLRTADEAPRGQGGQGGRGRGEGRRDGRPEGRGGRDGGGRGDNRRGDGRGGRGRDGYQRPDRSPDIRKSISDLTGGSLDVDGPGDLRGPEAASSGERGGQPRGERQGQRGGRGERGRQQGSGRGKGRGGKSQGRAPVSPGPIQSAGRGAGNPYDLPMEERMKRYREKYGQRGEEGAFEGGRPEGGRPGRGQGNQGSQGGARKGEGRRQAEAGQGGKGQAQRNGQRQAPKGEAQKGQKKQAAGEGQRGGRQGRGQGQGQRGGQAQRGGQDQRGRQPQRGGQAGRPASAPAAKPVEPKGFLGKLLGAFKKKSD